MKRMYAWLVPVLIAGITQTTLWAQSNKPSAKAAGPETQTKTVTIRPDARLRFSITPASEETCWVKTKEECVQDELAPYIARVEACKGDVKCIQGEDANADANVKACKGKKSCAPDRSVYLRAHEDACGGNKGCVRDSRIINLLRLTLTSTDGKLPLDVKRLVSEYKNCADAIGGMGDHDGETCVVYNHLAQDQLGGTWKITIGPTANSSDPVTISLRAPLGPIAIETNKKGDILAARPLPKTPIVNTAKFNDAIRTGLGTMGVETLKSN